MKKLIMGLLMLLLVVGGVLIYPIEAYANDNNSNNIISNTSTSNDLVIGVISDTHYYSKTLMSDCKEFEEEVATKRQLFDESEAILDSAFDILEEETPDVLFITGDLAREGEKANLQEISTKLEAFKKRIKTNKNKDLKIYVINGNHDINNFGGVDFSSGKKEAAESTTTKDFREIFKNMGYNSNSEFYTEEENVGGCLSYTTKLADGYTLIAVDTNKYSKDQTKRKQDVAETEGYISPKLLNWVNEKATEADSRGDKVIVIQHHAIVEHFPNHATYKSSFIVNNYKESCEVYAKAGVDMVFTGHMHANDIAKYTSSEGKEFYDIETGSLITFPAPIRIVKLNKTNDNKKNVDIKTLNVKEIDYIDKKTGEKITDLYEYSRKFIFSEDSVKPMLVDNIFMPELEKILSIGGTKKYLSTILNIDEDKFNEKVTDLLINKLPKTESESLSFNIWKFNFNIFYNATEKKVCIYETSSRKISPIKLSIDIDTIENKLLDNIFDDVDNILKNNSNDIKQLMYTFIDTALEYKIDDTHTLIEFMQEAYIAHIGGEEDTPKWVDDYILKIKDKDTLGQILEKCIKADSKILIKLVSKMSLKTKDVLKKDNNGVKTKLVYSLITSKFKNLKSVVKFGIKQKKVLDIASEKLSEIAYGYAYSLNNDDNYLEDNETNIILTSVLY